MSADLGNLALFEHYKSVGICKCRQSVSYRNCGSALYQSVESVLYLLFGLSVKRCGSFVKYQYLRVVENCSCNCYTLTFTAREIVTPFADNGIITVRHTGDEVVAVCRLCGSNVASGFA